MGNDLRELLRVRALRSRLAQNEALRARHALARAASSAAEARRRKESYERLAEHASAMASGATHDSGEACLLAGETHRLLEFAAGTRFRAHESVALIRRAELVRERAQEESDASSAEYRRLALRRESVLSQSKRMQRTVSARQREREEEARDEDRAARVAALRLGERS